MTNMVKEKMNSLTKIKIERYVISQLVLIIDGMALMASSKMYLKILVLFALVIIVYLNVYDYYREIKKSEMADKLNEEVANKILENVENDK